MVLVGVASSSSDVEEADSDSDIADALRFLLFVAAPDGGALLAHARLGEDFLLAWMWELVPLAMSSLVTLFLPWESPLLPMVVKVEKMSSSCSCFRGVVGSWEPSSVPLMDFLPLMEGLRELVFLLVADGRRAGVATAEAPPPAPAPGTIGFLLLDFQPVVKSKTSAWLRSWLIRSPAERLLGLSSSAVRKREISAKGEQGLNVTHGIL